jgi:class 3 adenylate cyclase
MERSGEGLPEGTVTFLFSDIEGSTRLVETLPVSEYRDVIDQHHRILRQAFSDNDGLERGTEGDSFLVVFTEAPSAIRAAV